MSNASVQSEVYTANPGGKPLFNCVYDSDKNKEICCDGTDNNLNTLNVMQTFKQGRNTIANKYLQNLKIFNPQMW